MKWPLLISIGLLIIIFSCKEKSDCTETAKRFKYNSVTGKCQDCNGTVGYNLVNLDHIQRTRDAECVDLSKLELITLLKGKTAHDLSYDSLYDFNFRGARFDSAKLYFNFIKKSDLSGANLELLQYGYASIDGEIDQYTILPEAGSCDEGQGSIICSH